MEGIYLYGYLFERDFLFLYEFSFGKSGLISLGFLFLLQTTQIEYISIIAEQYYTFPVDFFFSETNG